MSKTKIISIAILLVGLIGFSLYLNRDWFRGEGIQITHRLSPWMRDQTPRRPRQRSRRTRDLHAQWILQTHQCPRV
jgi:hypothetical protein